MHEFTRQRRKSGLEVNDIKESLAGKIEKSVIVRIFDREFPDEFPVLSGIACFTKCCSGIKILLSPYDIYRLKSDSAWTITNSSWPIL